MIAVDGDACSWEWCSGVVMHGDVLQDTGEHFPYDASAHSERLVCWGDEHFCSDYRYYVQITWHLSGSSR